MRHTIARMMFGAAALWAAGPAAAPALAAAGIGITPLLAQRTVTCLQEVDGTVYGGLDGGGVAFWPAADPTAVRVWTADDGLSGTYVTDLAWSGRNLWVGTDGAGLTRVNDPGGTTAFRVYAGNLPGLSVTAVTGAVVGDAERVWYGVRDAGVGVITNGVAGATYTAQNGLIADTVDAIAIHGDAVYFGSEVGVSRFAGNTFSDANTGLTNLHVNALAVAPDGTLTAGGRGGVYTWDDGAAAWSVLGTPGFWVDRIAWVDGGLVVLGLNASAQGIVASWVDGAFVPSPTPYPEARALAGGAQAWIGGRQRPDTMGQASGWAWYARPDGAGGWETWLRDQGSFVTNAEGLAFGADGRAWVGSWQGQGFGGLLGQEWVNVFEEASAANDSSGLINQSGNVLAMAAGGDGVVWVGQFASGGLLRHDPATGRTDQIVPGNSGLGSRRIINLAVHPDGPLLVLHDADNPNDLERVEVLVDPARWRNPDNWISLPTGTGGLGEGAVWDAYVESRDVVWFAVAGTGLVRWDINGSAAGPDDPLTWFDATDDRWDPPIDEFAVTDNDPKLAKGIAAGPDGSLWVGGDGLVRFFYDVPSLRVTVADFLLVKQDPTVEGLLGGGVVDIATGLEGDLWVACAGGLNRVRTVQGELEVDAWLDVMNYVADPSYGTLYTSNVIAGLPGFIYRKVVADPHSRRVLLSGDRGAALITPADGAQGGSPLAGVYLFPSPWLPGDGQPLALGGLDATDADPADVGIYTLEGQVVYRDPYVVGGAGFWSGQNRVGGEVATGLYVVKVTWHGATVLLTLAVVR